METEQVPQTSTTLTSEHKAFTALFLAVCLVVVIFIVSLMEVIMKEDELATEVAKDQGAVAAYCLFKAPTSSAVCSILAAEGETK